jgi:hypothetical protein
VKLPPLGPGHWLVFAAVALLFFAWGTYLVRAPEPDEPLPWLAEWQAQVLEPLADERLHLEALSVLVAGELWLQPRPQGARLLYRGEWLAAGVPWLLEAELALSVAERSSLMAAAGLGVEDAEQPLAAQLVAQLGGHGIVGLTLEPRDAVPVARLASSLGQPPLRLQLVEGEAWVYPQLGLTAHGDGEQLRVLQAVPQRVLGSR